MSYETKHPRPLTPPEERSFKSSHPGANPVYHVTKNPTDSSFANMSSVPAHNENQHTTSIPSANPFPKASYRTNVPNNSMDERIRKEGIPQSSVSHQISARDMLPEDLYNERFVHPMNSRDLPVDRDTHLQDNADTPNTNTSHSLDRNTISHDQKQQDKSNHGSDPRHVMNQGSGLGTQAHTSDRNADRQQTILNIERDIGAILRWENPARSGVLLVLLVGSIVVTRHYSLIQIFAGLLTVAIAVNFAYVTIVVQGRRVLLDSKSSHPYGNVIQDQSLHVDYRSVHLFSSLFVDLAETMIRGLSKIILIENNTASLKWLVIFYLTWTLSAYVSSMTIVLTFIISAFLIPRLYMSNKDVVNHHLQRGEHLIKTHLERTQNLATESVNDAYSKTRAYVSQIGTTGTDAANTLNKESLSLKQD